MVVDKKIVFILYNSDMIKIPYWKHFEFIYQSSFIPQQTAPHLWQIFPKFKKQNKKSFNQNSSSSHSQLSENKIIPICDLGARFERSRVQANIQTAATKVTDRDYFIFRKRLSCLSLYLN